MERKLDLYVEEMKLHMEESEFFLESEKIIRPIMLEIDQINQKIVRRMWTSGRRIYEMAHQNSGKYCKEVISETEKANI